MSTTKKARLLLTGSTVGVSTLLVWTAALGGPKSTEGIVNNEACFPGDESDLPVASFLAPLPTPIGETELWRITQPYNPYIGHPQAYTKNNVKIYGHNGEDLGGDNYDGSSSFETVRAPFAGKVILSDYRTGWGNTIVVASRVSEYSNAIITTHFHHLYERYVGAKDCATDVARGDEIGLEGATGDDYGKHLHFTVRYWANLDHFNQWVASGNPAGRAFLGYDAYLGHDSPDFRGSYLPGEGGVNVDYNSPFIHYGHLDPEPLIKDYFLDFGEGSVSPDADHFWSLDYVKKMRYYGIELGEWNGYFGVGMAVKRREVARWIKIALGNKFQGSNPGSQIFADVPFSDPDSPYIQALTTHPKGLDATTIDVAANFNPNNAVNRAEALKLIVLGFYANEYADFWKEYKAALESEDMVFQEWLYIELDGLDWTFTDFFFDAWYASYVYFGVKKGIVALGPENYMFRPEDGVIRAEMSKWIVTGYEGLHGENAASPCDAYCPEGQYCSPGTGTCIDNAECIPTIVTPCGQGGGQPDSCENSVCDFGETCMSCPQDCGLCPPECGDSQCNGIEDCETCSADCGECPPGCPDGSCDGMVESCEICPQDCGFCPPECGDNECNGVETCETCSQDCGFCPPECGDNQCNGGEACNTCPQDCGNCVCGENEVEQQACDPGWYCPPGTQERICNNDSWGPWGVCEADSGLKFYGDGGKHCGPVICLQITGSGNDSSLTATLSKADNSAFTNSVDLTIFQPSSNITDHYGCLPTQGQTSYNFQIFPDNFDISLGGTMWVNAQAFSPCVNGANYISEDAAVSQCSSN